MIGDKMKNKKTIIAIVLIGILAIGGTLAYYTSTFTMVEMIII